MLEREIVDEQSSDEGGGTEKEPVFQIDHGTANGRTLFWRNKDGEGVTMLIWDPENGYYGWASAAKAAKTFDRCITREDLLLQLDHLPESSINEEMFDSLLLVIRGEEHVESV